MKGELLSNPRRMRNLYSTALWFPQTFAKPLNKLAGHGGLDPPGAVSAPSWRTAMGPLTCQGKNSLLVNEPVE
jgi:hypothetical protein